LALPAGETVGDCLDPSPSTKAATFEKLPNDASSVSMEASAAELRPAIEETLRKLRKD
jgi:hypothetical protein